jgi:hypothetical protein
MIDERKLWREKDKLWKPKLNKKEDTKKSREESKLKEKDLKKLKDRE